MDSSELDRRWFVQIMRAVPVRQISLPRRVQPPNDLRNRFPVREHRVPHFPSLGHHMKRKGVHPSRLRKPLGPVESYSLALVLGHSVSSPLTFGFLTMVLSNFTASSCVGQWPYFS